MDYERVRLIASDWLWQRHALAPNGKVYFHPNDFSDDFSSERLEIQGWLIHELTHVWQFQQGMAVARRALVDRRYAYVLEQGKTFLQYGIEQQAQMVQDWFVARERGESCEKWACVPFFRVKSTHIV